MLSAIILAAGESTRMDQPKPLANFGKNTFLHIILQNFKNAGIEDVVIVLGHESERIIEELNLCADSYTINKNYKLGQFSSVQKGVKNLNRTCSGAFLALADQPQIGSNVFTKISKVFGENPNKIVIPTFNGKRGHPPVLPKWFFREILSATPNQKTSEIIRSHPDKVYELEIDDESILWNINTKADLERVFADRPDSR